MEGFGCKNNWWLDRLDIDEKRIGKLKKLLRM